MVNEDEVWFYGKGTSASDVLAGVTPLFKVKTTSIKYDVGRTINTGQKVPGSEYSKGYDAQCIQGDIVIEGEFVPTDAAWDTSAFTGRPFDFIHYLKCFANGLDPATGTRLTGTTYNCFSILIKHDFESTARSYAPGIMGGAIKNYYLIGKTSSTLSGNPAHTVKFTIPLKEVSDAVNLGRVA